METLDIIMVVTKTIAIIMIVIFIVGILIVILDWFTKPKSKRFD